MSRRRLQKQAKDRRAIARAHAELERQGPPPDGHGTITVEHSTEQRITAHRGPLPDPDTLRAYSEISVGSADLIFREFEANGKWVREHRSALLSAQIHDQRVTQSQFGRGQLLASVLVALMVVLGFIAIMNDHEAGGIALVGCGAGMATLVSTLAPIKRWIESRGAEGEPASQTEPAKQLNQKSTDSPQTGQEALPPEGNAHPGSA